MATHEDVIASLERTIEIQTEHILELKLARARLTYRLNNATEQIVQFTCSLNQATAQLAELRAFLHVTPSPVYLAEALHA